MSSAILKKNGYTWLLIISYSVDLITIFGKKKTFFQKILNFELAVFNFTKFYQNYLKILKIYKNVRLSRKVDFGRVDSQHYF
ncbi:hypothetical protein BpHYR1_005898 [Brachionus plicatilis]|uniref:Uncharacterized protein n=1 Tax=Brachionus plicatilis TaxID=10195 RepID=A0A3M7QLL0_BRAPC|nr:hypothetical protein BpHYR1_005898 [Brachionus plicatilis]